MAAFRYIVPALAVAGRAAAQCSGTSTISSAAEASALSACSTFSGSIAIATGTTDSIALDGITRITGSLTADNVTEMTELSADSLTTIDDSFTLNSLTILSTLNFPELTDVATIDWTALPALQGLSFTSGVQTAGTVSIINTQLATLDGIDLTTVDSMTISNNDYLDDIDMQIGNISTSLIIEANGRNVTASFPNLIWAYNITLRNVTEVDLASLASLNGSMGFYANFFTTISAPNLTTVGGSLSFESNEDLTNISFPLLKTVDGGLEVVNNTALKTIDFPDLETVGGALEFEGNFTTVKLPDLEDVKGAFDLQSSGDITAACDHFEPLSGSNNVIKGTFTCKGEEAKVGSTGTSTSSSSSSSASSTSSSGANAVLISGATGLMGVVAAIFGML